jgi:hypothetical protein
VKKINTGGKIAASLTSFLDLPEPFKWRRQ